MGKPNRIKEWREKRAITLEQLSEMTGVSVSYLSRMESGGRNVSLKNLGKIALALRVPERDLVNDEERQVPLVGYVDAGAVAHVRENAQGPFEMVDAPDDATPSTVGVEIRGDCLGSVFDQWLVFYDETLNGVPDHLVGKLSVVGLADGRIMIKRIERSRTVEGAFNLFSQFEEPIYDVFVTWAARIKSMRPRLPKTTFRKRGLHL